MNTKRYERQRPAVAGLLFLLLLLLPGSIQAQGRADKNDDEGIVMYSDTSGNASTDSYLPDAENDDTDQTEYADSTWRSSTPQTGSISFLLNDDSLSHPFRLIGDLFHSMLSVGLFLAIMLIVLLILVPLLLIVGLVYFILRLTRTTPYRPSAGEPPLTPDEIRQRQSQQTIRLACIGVALLLVEWFFGMAHIAGIVGIVLLCIAAGQWLSSRR